MLYALRRPYNPLLAEPMYLTKYIERMGTGIRIDGGSFVLTIRRKKPEPATKSAPG